MPVSEECDRVECRYVLVSHKFHIVANKMQCLNCQKKYERKVFDQSPGLLGMCH